MNIWRRAATLQLAATLLLTALSAASQVSVNSSGLPPHEDAMLDVSSTSKGFLPPRMTSAERDAIASPPKGLMIYNLDTDCTDFFNGTHWMAVCGVCQPQVAPPVIQAATSITSSGFTINWLAAANASGYRLDVSANSGFSTFIPGYQNQPVGNVTSVAVSGLSSGTMYYYRLKTEGPCGVSAEATTGSATTAFVGLLDQYSGAAAAYSVRLLWSGYAGPIVRVRRSSDNAEQNIGATASGDLDQAALTSFCGSGNCFVTTWYDQSGNSRNVIQPAAARQPTIVENGAVITQAGRAALKWPSTAQDYSLYFSDGGSLNNLRTTCSNFNVAKWSGNSGDFLWNMITNLVGSASANSNSFNAGFRDTGLTQFGYHWANIDNQGVFVNFGSYANTTTHSQFTVTFNDPTVSIWVNGPVSLSNSANLGTTVQKTNNGELMIGLQWKVSNGQVKPWVGTIQEVIYYPVVQTTTPRVAIETSQRTYFGIP